jgi:hypothetical protein
MAGPNLTTHLPIIQVQNKANTTPFTKAMVEAAGQTFAWGTPVQKNASGYTQAWDGTTVTAGLLGVAESFGLNLATPGAGAPTYPWGQVTGTISTQTYGSVPNQPGAVNIALGAPVSEGRTLYIEANADNIFEAMFDNSSGAVAADWTPTIADIGVSYGMTKDSAGPYYYVDKGKTGAGACVKIVGIDTVDGYTLNARVFFTFLPAAIQV